MRYLVPTSTKFIAGGKGFRIFVETDKDHLQVGETLSEHIKVGRRVIVPESRFKPVDPVQIEEYSNATTAAATAKPDIRGARISDDFDDAEIGEDKDVSNHGSE
jgi:hypothetical protein